MAEQLELFDDEEGEPGDSGKVPSAPKSAARESGPPPPPSPKHPDRGDDETLTAEAASLALDLGLPRLAKKVIVAWNRRMRTAAGRAFFQTGRIELNPKLQELPETDREREIRNTFLHELAHLVSHARARGRKIRPHGPEWRQACRELGIPGEDRCHSLDFQPRRIRRRFAYECGHCGSVVERVRKLKRPVACYSCCREHNGGNYHPRFRLREKPIG